MWNIASEGGDMCSCILTNNEYYIGLSSSRKRVIFVEFLRDNVLSKISCVFNELDAN
jgi:hypothetical protein